MNMEKLIVIHPLSQREVQVADYSTSNQYSYDCICNENDCLEYGMVWIRDL